jgi:mono/diheme cytochrome c family protein
MAAGRTAVVLGSLLAGSLLLSTVGCKVREPGKLETSLAENIKRRVTVGGKEARNPLPSTEENIHAGRENFSHYCFARHGLDGQNTGVPFADKMLPPVPSLASVAVQGYADGQLKWVIDNGISPSGMPASKEIFNDDEIWQIVIYLRHLPAKGSLGEPDVYSGRENLPVNAEGSAAK